MQNEDDLRGLAKVMDFMRALSILFVVINVYWFCYETFKDWGITIGVVDKILLNFQRTTGLFSTILWTKIFSVVFLALSCLGTKGVKEKKIRWTKIYIFLSMGFVLFFPELVVAGITATSSGKHYLLYSNAICWFPLPIGGRNMDVPPTQKQPDGRRVQYRKRIFHAGNKADNQRIFGESADPVLLQEEVESGLDKCSKPVSCQSCVGNVG